MLKKGLSYVGKRSMGGGKTLLKSKVYLCLLFLLTITTFVIFSQNFVNAAPRKKASVKRAASNKGSSKKASTKRAAVGKKNTKRAAAIGKNASTRKRAQSRVKSGTSKPKAAANTSAAPATNKAAASNVCPVGTFLKRKYNEETDEYTYYSAKTTECSLPEGDIVTASAWEKSNKANYPKTLQVKPAWMSESEASFLTCVSGYVEKTVNKVKTCVSVLEICPINEIVEKSGKVYINPDTQEECMAPEKSVVKNVKGDENLLSYTLADEKAYKFECPANYYPVTDSETSMKVKCEMCPSGGTSERGSSSINDCVNAAQEEAARKAAEEAAAASAAAAAQESARKQAEADAAAKQKLAEETAAAAAAQESAKLKKLRIKKVEGTTDDYTCIDGWTNNWGVVKVTNEFKDNNRYCYVSNRMGSSDADFLRKAFIMDKDGKIKNVVDRNAYGKNKRGCPVKIDKFYSYDRRFVDDNNRSWLSSEYKLGYKNFMKYKGMESSSGEICKFELIKEAKDIFNLSTYKPDSGYVSVRGCASSNSTDLAPKIGIIKLEMSSSDIDNTGVNGWTEEEYDAWGGYKPVLAYYYNIPSEFDGKTLVKNCSSLDTVAKPLSYTFNSYNEEVQKSLTSKNLFTYWN